VYEAGNAEILVGHLHAWVDAFLRLRLTAFVLAALVLAGCGSKPAGPQAAGPDDLGAETIDPSAATSGLKGLVRDDEGLPVAGAIVLLRPLNVTAVSGDDGAYDLGPLPPGGYRVGASLLGYRDTDEGIVLLDGRVLVLNLTLERLPSTQARSAVLGPYTGYFQCRWQYNFGNGVCGQIYSCIGACVDTGPYVAPLWDHDQNQMKFRLDPDGWQAIVLEAKWTPSSAATSPKLSLSLSYEGGSTNHAFSRSAPSAKGARVEVLKGETPVGQTIPRGEPKEPAANLTLVASMIVPSTGGSIDPADPRPVALVYELRFEIWATVFYAMPPPAGYTILPP
jgi:carboxypeptidase family protein